MLSGAVPSELRGICGICRVEHHFHNDGGLALAALEQVFTELEAASERALLDASRGKMIGVLVGEGGVTIKAYSGDLGGTADLPGWAPSINRREDTAEHETETLAEIASIEAALLVATPEDRVELRARRRRASQILMAEMIDAVRLPNVVGRIEPLRRVFIGDGIPSGTATCVLPKLIAAANRIGVRPLGVAEAWWGPKYGERRHGLIGAPCIGRCLPILGFLLCTEKP